MFDGQLGKVKAIKVNLELKELHQGFSSHDRYLMLSGSESKRSWFQRKFWRELSIVNWGAPIVPVRKPNEKYPIFGDYSVTINPHLKIPEH